MPTPVGHALAGLTIAWIAETFEHHADAVRIDLPRIRRSRVGSRYTAMLLFCGVTAIIPDVDIFFGPHRTYSHSLVFALVAGLGAALVASALGQRSDTLGVACGLAYLSHICLDWLGKDTAAPRGVMLLWPLSHTYFISGLDLFSEVSRRYWKPDEFILANFWSVSREVLILGPPAVAAWWWSRRALR